MADSRYTVQVTGAFADGHDPDQAAAELAELMKMPVPKIKALLANAPVAVKRDIDAKTAGLYQARIEQTGVICNVTPPLQAAAGAEPTPTAPSVVPVDTPSPVQAVSTAPATADVDAQSDPLDSTLNEFVSRESSTTEGIGNYEDTTRRGLRSPSPDEVIIPIAVAAGRGAGWVGDGFRLFKASPWVWIGITLIYFIGVMIVNIIPFIGPIAYSVIQPLLVGGLMLGCASLNDNEPLEITHLFKGFDTGTVPLLKLGGAYLGATILLVLGTALCFFIIPGAAIPFAEGMDAGETASDATQAIFSIGVLLMLLVSVSMFTAFIMMFWFAPALVILRGAGTIEAIKLSFFGCLKNFVPFLVYGLVMAVLAILASIPLALGWLVLGPVMMGSLYSAYRDIYPE